MGNVVSAGIGQVMPLLSPLFHAHASEYTNAMSFRCP